MFVIELAPVTDPAAVSEAVALGDEPYESLARRGQHMSNAEAVTYALEQIELARAALV